METKEELETKLAELDKQQDQAFKDAYEALCKEHNRKLVAILSDGQRQYVINTLVITK